MKVSENIHQSLLIRDDDRGCEDGYRQLSEYDFYMTDVLWPRSQLNSSGSPWATDGSTLNDAAWFMWPRYDGTGAHSCYTISGITYDANSVPLPGVTVKCYTTADDVERGVCQSDMVGRYACPTLINAAHYLRAYLTNNPDVAGTSRNDLMPS